MIKGFEHVGISVSNLDRSVAFYRDAFGMEVVAAKSFGGELYERLLALRGVKGRVATLEGHNLQIELFEFRIPEPGRGIANPPLSELGISHFCLLVDDIDVEYQRLRERGVIFHSPPTGDEAAKAVFARDPDGNAFELIELLDAAPTTVER